ncbi:ADP-ribosylglycohydrolase family protein [Clostridium oceanicum]|uniref:ADP-ribosylglycohydrolase family protein n=1 Tax=Clostridium oceanicum TaxID=1543 RepID=A0ABP3UKC2_9CLOT
MNKLPKDYIEKVHAGVLGKVIGVYLGHPVEGALYQDIIKKHGEVWYYLQEKEEEIVEPDDDITGTFLFPRAIEDYDYNEDTLAQNIGKVWLNGLVEHESAVAWSGKGVSTEHTAYLNLKKGMIPPHTGSIETNGSIVAQQVGGQIFMDCWGLLCPDDPALAVKLVSEAVSVHHDGEAIYGARIIAAIIAMAFTEKDMKKNLERALKFVPEDSNIYKINKKLLEIREKTEDFHEAFKYLYENHSYNHYPGKCPTEPNHGIVILALLYGENKFSKSMMIVDTCGWDADGNSAVVGTILGVSTGVKGINKDANYIKPMKGLVYVPYAEGGEAITDCTNLTYRIVNMARKMRGISEVNPKNNARFNFSLPGSLHGFELAKGNLYCPYTEIIDTTSKEINDIKGLEICYKMMTISRSIRAEALTLEEYDKRDLPYYKLTASPTLYSGQVIKMGLISPNNEVEARLFVKLNADKDEYITLYSSYKKIVKGNDITEITYKIPNTKGRPIGKVGFEIKGSRKEETLEGKVIINYIDWKSEPNSILIPEDKKISLEKWWNFTWIGNVNMTDNLRNFLPYIRLSLTDEIAVLSQGTRDWENYKASAEIMPHNFVSGGIGIRCRGLKRYIALLLTNKNTLKLVAKYDEEEIVIDEKSCDFEFDIKNIDFNIQIIGDEIKGEALGIEVSGINPYSKKLSSGAAAIIVEDGAIKVNKYKVTPAK